MTEDLTKLTDNELSDRISKYSEMKPHERNEAFENEEEYQKLMNEADQREKKEEIATRIDQTWNYVGERAFDGKLQVLSLAHPEARYIEFIVYHFQHCKDKNCLLYNSSRKNSLNFTLFDYKNGIASSFASYFDTNNPKDFFRMYLEVTGSHMCSDWSDITVLEGDQEHSIARGTISGLEGQDGRCWFIGSNEADLSKQPNWIIAKGYICKGVKGRIGVLINSFQSESEVTAPSNQDYIKAKEILSKYKNGVPVVEIISKAFAKVSQLKGTGIKHGFEADFLTQGSPTWVKTPEGEKELGITSGEIGLTTSAKSQREKYLIRTIGTGKYQTGKLTPAGLCGGLEKIEGIGWVLKKGLLSSADLGFAIIDNMPPHFLDEQIESRRDGTIKIQGIKSGELWARCRLKLLSNPLTPFGELMYKCLCLKMYDPKFLARFCYIILTDAATTDDRYDSEIKTITEDEKELINATIIILKWNLSKETTFEVPITLWAKIMERGKELELNYGVEDIPLYVRNLPYKLSLLTYSFALFEGEEPANKHVQFAYDWLDSCARELQLDEYKANQFLINELTEGLYSEIKHSIMKEIGFEIQTNMRDPEETYIAKILDYLAKHDVSQRDEVAGFLGVEPKTTTLYVNKLKGQGLVKSTKNGYSYTAKGVKFVKLWFKESQKYEKETYLETLKSQKELDHLKEGNKEHQEHVDGDVPDDPHFPDLKGKPLFPENPTPEAINYALKLFNGTKEPLLLGHDFEYAPEESRPGLKALAKTGDIFESRADTWMLTKSEG